ncbi:hypothetical protein LXT21_39225 [Myxococcus sp. K38C18041901]|uniref:hypothetical protein n=1 Tax=Myxococcus guangdongensis TaxID=2906760 RepID=UPI0020A77445|nr:hypothetical protein [Myxococcus guangdongensis]MCP3064821.1 hypothetical protein [Myxococcus guangdongensis]
MAVSYLLTSPAYAQEASDDNHVKTPPTQNPYVTIVATLYELGRYEEALSKVTRSLEGETRERTDLVFLKLMRGVLLEELGQKGAEASFREALALDDTAQLPVQSSRRVRKLFERARSATAQPLEEEPRPDELDPAAEPSGPPPRRSGLLVGLRGEVDVLGLSTTLAVTPAVSLGYTRGQFGAAVTVLTQTSPGLRLEGQAHPFNLGWIRPYARLGTTAFFLEKSTQGDTTRFMGGASGRAVLGLDVQWNEDMSAFVDVAYERFFSGGERFESQSLLLSLGAALFP